MARTKLVMALALTIALVGAGSAAWADAPPGPYFNGFETNTAGWFNFSGATVTRVPSGSGGTYAPGTLASGGSWYARLGKDPSPDSCVNGGGTQPIYYGPYTNWGGYSSVFPPGGYSTGVDIYLDVPYAIANPDTRFDWDSAVSNTSGGFRRDFAFNVSTDPLGFVISASNNANRCGANPATGTTPFHVTASGWYEFRHTFTGATGLPLVANLQLVQKPSNLVLATWTLTNATDIIGTAVGGNRYGWFVQNEFNDLPIDNSYRTAGASTPNCVVKITDGGTIHASNGDKATFGGNVHVSSSGDPSGQQTYQDHGPLQPMTVKSIQILTVLCSSDRTEATIYGTATVNGGGTHPFEIQLSDAGEPGRGDTYGIRVPDQLYDSGVQFLDGGNIQIT